MSTTNIYLGDTAKSFTINGTSRNVVLRMGSKFGVTENGDLYASSATLSGSISGSSISGGTISGASISAGSISGATISGGSVSGASLSGNTGSIGGFTITDNALTATGITLAANGNINCSALTISGKRILTYITDNSWHSHSIPVTLKSIHDRDGNLLATIY